MKRVLYLIVVVSMLFATTGCIKQSHEPNDSLAGVVKGAGEQIQIYSQSPSRTENSGLNTLWSADDAINVFHAESCSEVYLNDGEFSLVDVVNGRFQGNLNDNGALVVGTTYDWYASYPYNENLTSPKGNGCSFVIGSEATACQVQSGNGSTTHLAGEGMPLVGVAKGVKADETPSIAMINIASMVELRFKNNSNKAVAIKQIAFSAENCALVGSFKIDFSDTGKILCTPCEGEISDTAVLRVESGEVVVAASEALFYLAVAPFTVLSGGKISFDITLINSNGEEEVCSKSQTLNSNISFVGGKCKTITLNYDATLTSIEIDMGELPSMSSDEVLFKSRMMCYNVRNCKGMDDVVDYQRVGEVIRRKDPDVVALQELDSMTTRYPNQDVLKNLGDIAGLHPTFGAARDYKGGKYGVGVLSKEKPLSHRCVTLPCTNEVRVLLIVEFKDFYFCCTHSSLLAEYRVVGANIITEEAAKLNKPVFIAGDFNAKRSEEAMQILAENFYLFEKEFATYTFPADKPNREIDYIGMYKHKEFAPVIYNHLVIPAIVESDHRPIVADVELYRR